MLKFRRENLVVAILRSSRRLIRISWRKFILLMWAKMRRIRGLFTSMIFRLWCLSMKKSNLEIYWRNMTWICRMSVFLIWIFLILGKKWGRRKIIVKIILRVIIKLVILIWIIVMLGYFWGILVRSKGRKLSRRKRG